MAFLNQKERILDIVLTDKGRELLSKNQLQFKYYAFSDEGINYSGSLSASVSVSSSLDDIVRRNFSFEADQRKERDLRSFLYTIDRNKKVLPQFRTSIDISSSLQLERRYKIETISLESPPPPPATQKPIAVIARVTLPKQTKEDRNIDYIIKQSIAKFFGLFGGDK